MASVMKALLFLVAAGITIAQPALPPTDTFGLTTHRGPRAPICRR